MGPKKPVVMRPGRCFFLLLSSLVFALCFTRTIYFIAVLDVGNSSVTADIESSTTPSSQQQQQQQQHDSDFHTSSSSSVVWDDELIYANATYRYRYSARLFSKTYPTVKDGNDILPSVIFGVCANVGRPARRRAIRKSWARDAPVYFVVAGDWESVSKEFVEFGDLLWIDTPEDHRNALTPKTFAFIQFASRKAIPAISQALGRPLEYMFKTDDDVYVNSTEIRRELFAHGRPDYYGLLMNETRPVRDYDDIDIDIGASKFIISREEYPRDTFPQYATGVGYALSKRFGLCATKAMAATPRFMPWEDVATGLLAETCHVEVTSSAEDWSHFVSSEGRPSEIGKFPYDRLENGTVMINILHKVEPWFFEPLARQASLLDAAETRRKQVEKNIHERKQRAIAAKRARNKREQEGAK